MSIELCHECGKVGTENASFRRSRLAGVTGAAASDDHKKFQLIGCIVKINGLLAAKNK